MRRGADSNADSVSCVTTRAAFCYLRGALDKTLSLLTRQQIFGLAFFAILLFLVYQLALMFQPFLLAMVWATVLAHLLYPLYSRLTARLGGRESLAAGILTIGIMLLGVLPLIWMGGVIVREAVVLEKAIRIWVSEGGLERLPEHLSKLPLGGEYLRGWYDRLEAGPDNLEEMLISSAKSLSQFLVGGLTGFVKNVFAFFANALIMIVTLFFFFRDGRDLVAKLYELIPLDSSHKSKIFVRLDLTMRAVVKGVVVTAIVQGLLAGLAYAVLGVPVPVVLMAVTTILAPIPFGGTALVWVPVALWLLWAGPVWKGVALLVWGAGIVSTVDQVLRPLLIGHGAQIPVFLLMFSVLGGLSVYGVIGIFVGPIVVALLLTALQIYREEYHHPTAPAVHSP